MYNHNENEKKIRKERVAGIIFQRKLDYSLSVLNTFFFFFLEIICSMRGGVVVGMVELTLTPNAAIFSMHSTVNIPVKHMFMYFSVFLYASLCRWNCNAYTDKHTRPTETNGRTDRQTNRQTYKPIERARFGGRRAAR